MIRQIEFALFDILIHKDLNGCELLDDNHYKKVLEILKSSGEKSVLLNNRVLSFSLTHSHISLMVGMLQDTTATNGQKFCPLIVTRVLKEKMIGKNQF